MSVDTIAAPITAQGRGAVVTVRISGDRARHIAERLFLRGDAVLQHPRRAVLTGVLDVLGESGEELDEALVVFFPAPNSFTGDDVLEVSLHGSVYILRRFLETLWFLGARPARAGEFSERAFLAGKLDLTQAEAVADLVNAESQAQARAAKRQLSGALTHAVSELGEPLRNLLAEIEAYIDFPEEDIQPASRGEWHDVMRAARARLERYCETYRIGRLVRSGAVVVLAGLPNAGKSSLLNCLLGEDRAIVTAVPGTTRDSIEERLTIGSLLVRLCDTAGLELDATAVRKLDEVERLGVERSWKLLREADVVVYLRDLTKDFAEEQGLFSKVQASNQHVLLVGNKVDCVADKARAEASSESAVLVSAKTGEGKAELLNLISQRLLSGASLDEQVLISTERHYLGMLKAAEALDAALESLNNKAPAEIISLEVRSALGSLTDIVGVTSNEELLGRIFSKFCIGK